jgi:membrane protease YdiL (CAAX protease family)
VGLTAEMRRQHLRRRALILALAAGLLFGLVTWLFIELPGYHPELPAGCNLKPIPDPLLPVPNIVLGCLVAFVAGRALGYLRERRRRRP